MTRPLRILTWHIHGNYLYYLVAGGTLPSGTLPNGTLPNGTLPNGQSSTVPVARPHQFYLPVKPGDHEGYGGRLPGFPWPDNVHDVPAEEVRRLEFDCILFQSHKNYLRDQYEILSEAQRRLPRIFVEHNPPREHPTNTRHPVDDPDILLVHVTHFNDLMWDNGRSPTRVIEHGVIVPEEVRYSGELDRGVVVVNGLSSRRRLRGADVFERVCEQIPIDLVGMEAEELGGLGALGYDQLHAFEARYRFFFNPIRYTSLGLAVCEAMMIGMPVIGLATTEMVTAVENNVSGYVSTDVSRLIEAMHYLLANPAEAQRLGEGARRHARERFAIERFHRDWNEAFDLVTGSRLFQQQTRPVTNLQAQSSKSTTGLRAYPEAGPASSKEGPPVSGRA